MQLHNNALTTNQQNAKHDNSVFGIVALFIIIFSALNLHGLIIVLNTDNRLIKKLWEPSEKFSFFAVPVFVVVSLIMVNIFAPNNSPMKKIFKISSIIGIILFIIFSLFMVYMFGLASGMRN